MAVPTYVELSDSGSLGTVSTLTHTVPSGWAAGDLCVAVLTCATNRTVASAPAGWDLVETPTVGNVAYLTVYEKVLEAGDVNAAHSWPLSASSSATNQVVFLRVTGHHATTPVNVDAGAVDGSAVTSHVSPAVTTTEPDCLILRVLCNNSLVTTSSGDTGTEVIQSLSVRVWRSSKAAAGSTGTATYTTGIVKNVSYVTLAVQPAAGSGTTVTPTTLALTTATFAPTVTATGHQTLTPATLALSLATFAPTVTAGGSQSVTPSTLALALTTFAPTVSATTSGAGHPFRSALIQGMF
jgi:hypothetical protein